MHHTQQRIQKLLSLPDNLAASFHRLTGADPDEWFVTSDPPGSKLGSGGGTAWLIDSWRAAGGEGPQSPRRRVILHAGGHSRRLPAYASSGKVLTPVPVFRWKRGQSVAQNLLSLQLPLYERILADAPESLTTLIASGDVYIQAPEVLPPVPEADVVCYGLWVDPQLATHHGVFVSDHATPDRLKCMLQKPSAATLEKLADNCYFLMDIGVWLLSDRAMELLCRRGREGEYDMYSQFGGALGEHPTLTDEEVAQLSVAVVPLQGGEFYHYGTSRELLSSTVAVQNRVHDQRQVMQRRIKPSSSLFTQNSAVDYTFTNANEHIWVENSCIGRGWTLTRCNIITGVPDNEWHLTMPPGACLDIEPISGTDAMAVRPYGFDDQFRGHPLDPATIYMGIPMPDWMAAHGVSPEELEITPDSDMQSLRIFPLLNDVDMMGRVANWMISGSDDEEAAKAWHSARRLSADDIAATADLDRLFADRLRRLDANIGQITDNWARSVCYQLDLADLADRIVARELPMPAPLPDDAPADRRMHSHMFRSRIASARGEASLAALEEGEAFGTLSRMLMAASARQPVTPRLNVYSDQIVWGRSPARIDVAGGWTDTPPYSTLNGGAVVNIAVNLNGQQPLQVYVKPAKRREIILRSIDLGASEVVSTYEQLADFAHVGSPFAIPKAALALAGFLPRFCGEQYRSLTEQLDAIGGGIELTLLSAIPAGSGLGTSSILASTVLGALSDFCGLGWDAQEICTRTLALEQMLTTGGGWQDQYGGVLRGVKLLQAAAGGEQPHVSWLPDHLFTGTSTRGCHLLYYTGITRTAKDILAQIVKGMFLNSREHMRLLADMRQHALEMAEAIQHSDFERYGRMVMRTWHQNVALDPGTDPESVRKIIDRVSDYCLGYKLPGAGGGGFLYMVAKDPEAAARIVTTLERNAPNSRARFVEMTLSDTGFQVSRS